MNFDRTRGTEGFTLIEVLVALSVVAVTLSAIGSLIAVTIRGARSVSGHLALVETARFLPESRDENAAAVDGVALGLLLVGFSALVSGLLEMHTWGPGSPATIGAIGAGLALDAVRKFG